MISLFKKIFIQQKNQFNINYFDCERIHSKKAVSLVELLVSLIAGAIIVLAVGAISTLALEPHQKVGREAMIYGEISYGIKLIQKKAREANSMAVVSASAPWQGGERLEIANGNQAFGLCDNVAGGADLVYISDSASISACTNPEILFSVESGDSVIIDLDDPDFDPDPVNSKTVTIQISGDKNNIRFGIITTIWRRNP